MRSTLILAIVLTFNSMLLITLSLSLLLGCGPQFDLTELTRIRAITCPSVCAAYADAVDAGVGLTPEDEALIGVCECQ